MKLQYMSKPRVIQVHEQKPSELNSQWHYHLTLWILWKRKTKGDVSLNKRFWKKFKNFENFESNFGVNDSLCFISRVIFFHKYCDSVLFTPSRIFADILVQTVFYSLKFSKLINIFIVWLSVKTFSKRKTSGAF